MSAESVYGVISLIFWSVTVIVIVKYVLLVMRADNDGEGGIMALITLIRGLEIPGRVMVALVGLGILGASLFFGDSMITPAISVLALSARVSPFTSSSIASHRPVAQWSDGPDPRRK